MNDTITIDRAEYEALLEDRETLSDIQSFDRAMADYKPENMIPDSFVERLLNGESPVAVYRDFRGMTQAELSRKTGVNRVQIIDIEKGRKKGSVETLSKLASALGVQIEDLLPTSA